MSKILLVDDDKDDQLIVRSAVLDSSGIGTWNSRPVIWPAFSSTFNSLYLAASFLEAKRMPSTIVGLFLYLFAIAYLPGPLTAYTQAPGYLYPGQARCPPGPNLGPAGLR